MKLSYKSFLLSLALSSAMSVQAGGLRGGSNSEDVMPINVSNSTIRSLGEDDFFEIQSGGLTLPYLRNCELGSGINFDEEGSPCKTNAIQRPPSCSGGDRNACEENNDRPSASRVESYFKTSTSTQETSNLMNVVARAEGSYGPFSASVGADFLRDSSQSTNSISFFIGQSAEWGNRRYNNFGDLQLTERAFGLLKRDPLSFVEIFGTSFVHRINRGVSFIGSATLRSADSTSTESLSTFAEIGYNEGIFSASGSVNFNKATDASSSSLEIVMTAIHTGRDTLRDFPTHDPVEMRNYFLTWQGDMDASTAQDITMNTLSFLQLQQVSDYIASIEDREERNFVFNLLTAVPLQPNVEEEIRREDILTRAVMNTLSGTEQLLRNDALTCNVPESALDLILSKRIEVSLHLDEIQSLTMAGFLEVQELRRAGNLEFFKARNFEREVDALIEGWQCERAHASVPAGIVHRVDVCWVDEDMTRNQGRLVMACGVHGLPDTRFGTDQPMILETASGCEVEIDGVRCWACGNSRFVFYPTSTGADVLAIEHVQECLRKTTITGYWKA